MSQPRDPQLNPTPPPPETTDMAEDIVRDMGPRFFWEQWEEDNYLDPTVREQW